MTVGFCENLISYSRLRTREVRVGDVGIGADNPIRIQSMTTTDTMATEATVEQSLRMVEAGSELVRITAPNLKAAENLESIQKELRRRGCQVPLIADIHFTPHAAEVAARIVAKVRVNPGNYADRKLFKTTAYTDKTYAEEIERIHERFSPLVKICKENGTAMRIGCNHGSLSDRILSHYGDTPLGMVEAAWEFVRICEDHGYKDIVLSMKASNPTVMVHAYRLLMKRMRESENVYPVHLGVTEAGEGEDGRIKSAVGIGALLADGIGDTVRVSLTEDPEFEPPVARAIVEYFASFPPVKEKKEDVAYRPHFKACEIYRRQTRSVSDFGGENVPRVVIDYSLEGVTEADMEKIGFQKLGDVDKWKRKDVSPDTLYLGKQPLPEFLPPELKILVDSDVWAEKDRNGNVYPFFPSLDAYLAIENPSNHLNVVKLTREDLDTESIHSVHGKPVVLLFSAKGPHPTLGYREAALKGMTLGMDNPIIWLHEETVAPTKEVSARSSYQIRSSCRLGSLLIDGLTNGIWCANKQGYEIETLFGLYQSTRLRISKTEYISCPSCGRTLFDLQEVTANIRRRTEHLKGVKIGIMGCIVNGPGEMADADFGYVGTGPGRISLYKGQQVVSRNIDEAVAVDELIKLIKEHNMWVDPEETGIAAPSIH